MPPRGLGEKKKDKKKKVNFKETDKKKVYSTRVPVSILKGAKHFV